MTTYFQAAYDLVEKIGQGGFGSVYKVRRRSDGAFFASKEIDYSSFSETKQKLVTFETELLSTLRHPAIAGLMELYDDTERDVLYIIMELFDRGDLKNFIKNLRIQLLCVSEAQVWFFLEQILEALCYMHNDQMSSPYQRKIIHRDIKPENIVITRDGRVKLIDFGICKELVNCSVTHTRCGTSQYAAPEVFVKRPSYDERIDIWALGCVAYELASSRSLFPADKSSTTTITEVPPILLPGFSPLLAEFISSMVVINPEMRPSAKQLLVHLQNLRLEKQTLSSSKFALSLSVLPVFHDHRQRLDSRLNRQDKTEMQLLATGGQTSTLKDTLITSVCCINNEGKTALHLAAEANKKFVAKALIPYEAGMVDNAGNTALSIAVRMGHTDIAEMLAPTEAFACISKGEGPNDTDEFGMTPLMWAAITNDVGSIKVCLTKGLYVRLQDHDGMTALMHAAQNGNIDCCKMLLEAEAGITNRHGETALFFAITADHIDIINLLFEKEAIISVNRTVKGHRTILEAAAFAGNMDIIAKLLPLCTPSVSGDPMFWSTLAQNVTATAVLQHKKYGSLSDNLRYLGAILSRLSCTTSVSSSIV